MAVPVELLQQVPLFADLSKKELKGLSAAFKEETFEPGQTIAVEDDRSNMRFFVIGEGTASVSVRGVSRGTLGPGDAFGEIALIDEGNRSATVTAETAIRCYGITPWVFRPLVEENPKLAWKLLQALARRLRAVEASTGGS